jgi:hypothetical protein
MAWAKRGRKLYFYRSRWTSAGCRHDYFGRGAEAQAAAALDAERRAERQARRQAAWAEHSLWESAEAPLLDAVSLSGLLVRAALLGAGLHLHQRSEWRRWHDGNNG